MGEVFHPVHLGCRRRKVDMRFDVNQRASKRVDLLAVMLNRKQVGLDGTASFHRGKLGRGSEHVSPTKRG